MKNAVFCYSYGIVVWICCMDLVEYFKKPSGGGYPFQLNKKDETNRFNESGRIRLFMLSVY